MPPQQKRRRTCYGRSQLPPHVVHETHTHTHAVTYFVVASLLLSTCFVSIHICIVPLLCVFSRILLRAKEKKKEKSKVKITLYGERESLVMAMASSPSMANSRLLSSIDKHKHRTYRQSAVNDQCVGGAPCNNNVNLHYPTFTAAQIDKHKH